MDRQRGSGFRRWLKKGAEVMARREERRALPEGSGDATKPVYLDHDTVRAALSFAQVLHADKEATYLTLPEAPGAAGRPVTFHGALEEGLGELNVLNRAGHGIFITVNDLDPQHPFSRTSSNVTRVRSLFVDLDGAPLPTDWSLVPHLTVETSPGRYQVYWVTEGVPLDRFSELQLALAALFDGDPAVKDLARVMRVPGFVHWKREPFRSRLLRADDRPAYTLDEMLDSIVGLAEELEKRHRTPIVTMVPRNAKERERLRRYAAAVFEGEVEAVRVAPQGGRHDRLVRAARRLGQFVGSGALEEAAVERALRTAALGAGLERREIDGAVAWGLRVGMEDPRGLPVHEEIEFGASGFHNRDTSAAGVPNAERANERGETS